MSYIIAIGDTVRIKFTGEEAKITAKTIGKNIEGEYIDVWFMNNDFSKKYYSTHFEPIKGKCKYY